METKDFAFEVKELTDTGVIEGYASMFGNVDLGGDRMMPGAFADSLAKSAQAGCTIKMLWNHDPYEPIGVWQDMAEDARGLRAKGTLVMEVPRAREVLALMKAGAVGGLSIGYRTVKSKAEGNTRLLEKVDLFEISPVTFPMNDRARVLSAKADIEDIVEKLAAGDRLTEREFEQIAKGLGLSNSQAERAARIHLKGQGEPVVAASDVLAFLKAVRA